MHVALGPPNECLPPPKVEAEEEDELALEGLVSIANKGEEKVVQTLGEPYVGKDDTRRGLNRVLTNNFET